jgi:hypothetical protein
MNGRNISGSTLRVPCRPFAARRAAVTTAHHIRLASRLRSQGMLATTEGSQIAGLCTEDFDWDPCWTIRVSCWRASVRLNGPAWLLSSKV